ncbi:hypothetical protein [Methanolobus sp. WCC4]
MSYTKPQINTDTLTSSGVECLLNNSSAGYADIDNFNLRLSVFICGSYY